MPWLHAAAKPTLSGLAITTTAGNSRRTISALPSADPLSTQITVGAAASSVISAVRHSRSSAHVFQLTTTATSRSGISGGLEARRGLRAASDDRVEAPFAPSVQLPVRGRRRVLESQHLQEGPDQ